MVAGVSLVASGWLQLFPSDFWMVDFIFGRLLHGHCYFLHPSRWLLVILSGFWMLVCLQHPSGCSPVPSVSTSGVFLRKRSCRERWVLFYHCSLCHRLCSAMKVKSFMATNVCSAPPSITFQEASRLMVDRGVGSVVLLEHDVLRGIVTHADVVKHIAAGGETTQRVRTQLSDELLTVNEDTVVCPHMANRVVCPSGS